jgi:peroxiredoxin
LLWAALVGILALPAAAGNAVTDFSLKDVDGRNVFLSDFLGKDVIVINFWATWCLPCQQELPHVQRFHEKYKDQGLVVLGIAVDGPASVAKVKPHAKRLGLTFPILLDRESKVSATYDPRQVMPCTLVIGKDRTIRFTHEGYAPGDETKLEQEILGLLGGKVTP